jgi:hypothetical protein
LNSKFHRRLLRRENAGISEVVGALLLMIVVVVAVGTFAYYLNNLQNQTQNRQTFQNNIANDKLQISQLQFTLNNPLIRYEIYNPASLNVVNTTDRYYVQMVNPSTVNLIQEARDTVQTFSLISSDGITTFTASFNSINSSTTAAIENGSTPQIVFLHPGVLPPGGYGAHTFGPFSFRTASWSYALISVRNLNTQNSGIKAIQVNGIWLSNTWFLVSTIGPFQTVFGTPDFQYSANTAPLAIPAKATVNILVNLGYLSIPRNTSLQIVLLSIVGNYFTTFYATPFPSIQESVNTQNLLVNTQDVPNFDASKSTATNSSFIQSYYWQIDVPETGWLGDWSQVGSLYTIFVSGQPLQYLPTSFFTQTQVSSLHLQVAGPFRVTLTIVDGNGLMTTSQQIVFPADANIDPAVTLTQISPNPLLAPPSCAANPGGIPVTILVSDVFNQPLPNVPVTFIQTSGVVSPASQIVPTSNTPGATFGKATLTITCTGPAGLEAKVGNLPPIAINFAA